MWFSIDKSGSVAILLVFPIIGLVFGASTLASQVLLNIASSDGNVSGFGDMDDDKQMLALVALGVQAIPLFAVPMLLKGSLGALGSVGARIQGYADARQKASTQRAKERWGDTAYMRGRREKKEAKARYRDKRYAEALAGEKGKINAIRRRAAFGIPRKYQMTKAGRYAQDELSKSAQIKADQHFENAVKGAALEQVGLSNDEVAAIAKSGKIDDGKGGTRLASQHELAAATDRVMKSGSFDERREALEYVASVKGAGGEHDSASLRNRVVQGAYAKGDQNIYGTGFGNELVREKGAITGEASLRAATVKNAEGGNVAGEHVVQSKGATRYLVDSIDASTDATVKATAKKKVKEAAVKAETSDTTRTKYTPEIKAQIGRL